MDLRAFFKFRMKQEGEACPRPDRERCEPMISDMECVRCYERAQEATARAGVVTSAVLPLLPLLVIPMAMIPSDAGGATADPQSLVAAISAMSGVIERFTTLLLVTLGITGTLIVYIYRTGMANLEGIMKLSNAAIRETMKGVDDRTRRAQADADEAFREINRIKDKSLTKEEHRDICPK